MANAGDEPLDQDPGALWRDKWLLFEAMSRDLELSAAALRVGRCLIALSNHTKGFAWPSRQTIADQTGLKLRSVDRAVSQLEDRNWVTIDRVPGGRYFTNHYYLNWERRASKAEKVASTGRKSPNSDEVDADEHENGDEIDTVEDASTASSFSTVSELTVNSDKIDVQQRQERHPTASVSSPNQYYDQSLTTRINKQAAHSRGALVDFKEKVSEPHSEKPRTTFDKAAKQVNGSSSPIADCPRRKERAEANRRRADKYNAGRARLKEYCGPDDPDVTVALTCLDIDELIRIAGDLEAGFTAPADRLKETISVIAFDGEQRRSVYEKPFPLIFEGEMPPPNERTSLGSATTESSRSDGVPR